MTTLIFYGHSTEEKRYMMMYLANILSTEHTVTLSIHGSFTLGKLNRINYNDNLLIQKSSQPVAGESHFHLIDQCDLEEVNLEDAQKVCTFFVVGPERSVVESSEMLVDKLTEESVVIFQNVLYDTAISVKYLMQRLCINKDQKKYIQYLNDRDMGIQIENGYNETLDIRYLSTEYKKMLLSLLSDIGIEDKKRCKQMMKLTAKRG